MAVISMSDIKKGVRLIVGEVPCKIVEFQHVKPGKGAAFVRMKGKSFLNGKVVEKTVHAGDKFEVPEITYKTMQYLYDDGEMYQFMDNETYDQIGLVHESVGETKKWLVDGMNVLIVFHNGKPISVEVDEVIQLEVVETPPNFKGDLQGGKKPATLECGAVVQVPFHIIEGDIVKCDTRTGEYTEKVK